MKIVQKIEQLEVIVEDDEGLNTEEMASRLMPRENNWVFEDAFEWDDGRFSFIFFRHTFPVLDSQERYAGVG